MLGLVSMSANSLFMSFVVLDEAHRHSKGYRLGRIYAARINNTGDASHVALPVPALPFLKHANGDALFALVFSQLFKGFVCSRDVMGFNRKVHG